jgi:hypothetical protein
MRTTAVRFAVVGLTLAPAVALSTAAANAGDLDLPAYGPYPYGAPAYVPPPAPVAACRILFERRIDPYGREIVHRVRVCDDGPVYPSVNHAVAPVWNGYPPQPYYQPVPSGYPVQSDYYDYAPRPPAPVVGPGYYN